jgi:hypothetical protein
MDYFKQTYNKWRTRNQPNVSVNASLPIVRIQPKHMTSKYTPLTSDAIALNKTQLNVVCWNIENFVSINDLYKSENDQINESKSALFLKTLRQQDIILIQEWKNTNNEGDLLLYKLNNRRYKYSYTDVDRVAVIYNKDTFDESRTVTFKIPLIYEAPAIIEKTYTKGRQKYNMLTILRSKDPQKLPICIINFHLSAFSPRNHPGFHKRQLNKLIEDSISKIKEEGIQKYGLIIGGDTNYRNLGNESDNLLESLLSSDYNLTCGFEEYDCDNGKLRDVCKKNCINTKTQSFGCVHEKDLAKKGIKILRKNLFNEKSVPSWSIHDNRLDFVATNLAIDYSFTKIVKLCDLSDHSAIISRMKWKIQKYVRDKNSKTMVGSSNKPKTKRIKKKYNIKKYNNTRKSMRI